jgi:hypothetical protein
VTYEVTSVTGGLTCTWTVEAASVEAARRTARDEMRRTFTRAEIMNIRPIGYKPGKDIRS